MDEKQKAALAALGGNTGDDSGSSEVGSSVDMDSILNEDLDNIPDMPDFVNPKEGVYLLHVEEVDLAKEIGDNRAISISYTIKELIQAKGTEMGDDVKEGDKFSELYFMSTPKGAEYVKQHLKKILAPVSIQMGTANLRDTLQAFSGCDIYGVVKLKRDRDDKNKYYPQITKIAFPG